METRVDSRQTEYQRGAERLFAAVSAASVSEMDFGEQVRSALSAALVFLAAEPELARLLIVAPHEHRDPELLDSYRSWRDRYADLLRRGARSTPEATANPPFLEPTLLGGIRWQLARRLLDDEAARLPELAPQLSRYVLCYYLPPEQSSKGRRH